MDRRPALGILSDSVEVTVVHQPEQVYNYPNPVQRGNITTFRYYLNGFNKTLAMRLYAGIGYPYLNSTILPYVEQFFSGDFAFSLIVVIGNGCGS